MPRKQSIEKEWDDAVEAWADFVRNHKDYYRDELNNPAAFEVIGDVRGLFVLDLACGEGYNTRILAGRGARTTGIDFSEKMIRLARLEERKHRLGIRYHKVDAADLKGLSSDCFDLVTCFMSLQDIEHYEKAISEVARVLKNSGRFIFSIPHPCFETTVRKRMRIHAWLGYFGTVKCPIRWNMKRLSKPFRTTGFHRTLSDYSRALYKNGFLIRRMIEPTPTSKAARKHPPLREVLVRPQSVIIESVKASRKARAYES